MQRLLSRTRAAFDQPLSARVATLRRDLGRLFGASPPPVARRAREQDPLASARHELLRGTLWLVVTEVVRETLDAVTLVFEPRLPSWQPGQFLTVAVDVDGERLRRAYSLCTRPGDVPAITVKRIADGRVSRHLVEHARAGMRLEVRGPSGQFVLPARTTPRCVLLIGGGSGITPLVALAEQLLADGDHATLVYGNRSLADVIFKERIDRLATTGRASSAPTTSHGGQLVVRHVLERPPDDWQGGVGRLDRDALIGELRAAGSYDLIYSCGPAPMMDAVREACDALGIDRRRLHEERFQSLGEVRAPSPASAQPLSFRLGDRAIDVVARPGTTILEAGLAAGLPMPFSCTMGGCGACRVKVRGEVVHDTPNGLSPEEAAAGYAFACCARPLAPCAIEVPAATAAAGDTVPA